jgi:hypothetical protein
MKSGRLYSGAEFVKSGRQNSGVEFAKSGRLYSGAEFVKSGRQNSGVEFAKSGRPYSVHKLGADLCDSQVGFQCRSSRPLLDSASSRV